MKGGKSGAFSFQKSFVRRPIQEVKQRKYPEIEKRIFIIFYRVVVLCCSPTIVQLFNEHKKKITRTPSDFIENRNLSSNQMLTSNTKLNNSPISYFWRT